MRRLHLFKSKSFYFTLFAVLWLFVTIKVIVLYIIYKTIPSNIDLFWVIILNNTLIYKWINLSRDVNVKVHLKCPNDDDDEN